MVFGPQPYTPSADFVPSLSAPVNPPSSVGPGLIGSITSGLGQMFSGLASDKGQAAIGSVYNAVATWKELDVRDKEASTAQKLAAMANSWLNPGAYPSTATAPYVSASSQAPATPGPVEQGGGLAGLSPAVLLIGGAVLLLALGRR
ncbi:MAG: hypothetical protein PHS60_02195 [Zavarzinia sp.]|nr:hypothetical protein [Zavarzinia sp.]